jgi:hypothetical protein
MMNSNFTDKDIICAQGKFADLHPGNVMFRKLVNAHKQTYAQAPNSDKRKISRGIVAALRRFGFNFLKFDTDTGCYDDIGDKKAAAKTSQALREKRNNMGDSNSSSYVTSSNTSSEESCVNLSIQFLQSLSEEEQPKRPTLRLSLSVSEKSFLRNLHLSHQSFLLSKTDQERSEMSLSVEPIPLTDEQATGFPNEKTHTSANGFDLSVYGIDRLSSMSLDGNGKVEAV